MSTSNPNHIQYAALTKSVEALSADVTRLTAMVTDLAAVQVSVLKTFDELKAEVGPLVTSLSASPMFKMLTGK